MSARALLRCTTPGRVFVGQRAEAFAVNLGEIFDLERLTKVAHERGRFDFFLGAASCGSSASAKGTSIPATGLNINPRSLTEC